VLGLGLVLGLGFGVMVGVRVGVRVSVRVWVGVWVRVKVLHVKQYTPRPLSFKVPNIVGLVRHWHI